MAITDRNDAESAATRILHAGSRMLFCHWEARRAESACPTRADFQMSNLLSILPNIAILENKPGLGWTYRLAGTAICTLFSKNLTGHGLLSGFEQFEREIIARVLDIAQDRLQPGLIRMRLFHSARDYRSVEFLVLPVMDEASGKVQLIGSYFVIGADSQTVPVQLVRRELISARLIWTEHDSTDERLKPFSPYTRLRLIEGGLSSKLS